MAMTTKGIIPENIQTLLDQADLSLLRCKHDEASTFFWKATEAAIRQAALSHGHKLASSEYDDVEPFIDSLDQRLDPGVGLMAAYLVTLEIRSNGDGQRMDLDDVVFYEPVVHSFIIDLLVMAE